MCINIDQTNALNDSNVNFKCFSWNVDVYESIFLHLIDQMKLRIMQLIGIDLFYAENL